MRLAVQTIFALLLLTCWLPASAQPQPGQPPAQATQRPAAAGLSAAEADRLSALLRDESRRAELLRTLEALSAVSRAQSGGGAAAAPGAPAAPAPTAAAAPAAEGAAPAPAQPQAP